jgi:hypothetical protein
MGRRPSRADVVALQCVDAGNGEAEAIRLDLAAQLLEPRRIVAATQRRHDPHAESTQIGFVHPARVEAALNVRLFHRIGRSMSLTNEGRLLYGRLRDYQAQLQQTVD